MVRGSGRVGWGGALCCSDYFAPARAQCLRVLGGGSSGSKMEVLQGRTGVLGGRHVLSSQGLVSGCEHTAHTRARGRRAAPSSQTRPVPAQ